jgi:hypothetical protein
MTVVLFVTLTGGKSTPGENRGDGGGMVIGGSNSSIGLLPSAGLLKPSEPPITEIPDTSSNDLTGGLFTTDTIGGGLSIQLADGWEVIGSRQDLVMLADLNVNEGIYIEYSTISKAEYFDRDRTMENMAPEFNADEFNVLYENAKWFVSLYDAYYVVFEYIRDSIPVGYIDIYLIDGENGCYYISYTRRTDSSDLYETTDVTTMLNTLQLFEFE